MSEENSKETEQHQDYVLFQDDMRVLSNEEPIWDSPALVLAWQAWLAGRNRLLDNKSEHKEAHTLGGFKGGFYVINKRPPTEQEIFDAGMRGGRAIDWSEKKTPKESILGRLLPNGLTLEQKLIVLETNIFFAYMAFKNIAEGRADPAGYAKLTLMHLHTRNSPYLVSNELSEKEAQDLFDASIDPNPIDWSKAGDPIYTVRWTEVLKFTRAILAKSKL